MEKRPKFKKIIVATLLLGFVFSFAFNLVLAQENGSTFDPFSSLDTTTPSEEELGGDYPDYTTETLGSGGQLLRTGSASQTQSGDYENCDDIDGWGTAWASCLLRNLVRDVGYFFRWIAGGILAMSGYLFDKTIDFSVVQFKTLADNDAVNLAWATLRNVANLFFIFILLYAAIGMILQLQSVDGRRILVTVIIIALLINFSAFFTRIIIDVSNVAAYQFYQGIASDPETGKPANLSVRFQKSLNLAPLYNLNPDNETAFVSKYEEGTSNPNIDHSFMKTVVLSFGVVMILIIATFLFLAAAIMFVVRTVTLIILIVLSPLAFLMYAFPNQKGLYDKWWDTLLKQAFFAPLFLLMMWAVAQIIQPTGDEKLNVFQRLAGASDSNFVGLTISFMVLIGLMFGALIVAKQLGAKGASMAMKGAGAITGGMVGGSLFAAKQLRRLGTAAVAGGLSYVPGVGPGRMRQFATSQLKNISTDTKKAVTSTQGKVGRAVKEFVQAPVKKTLAATAGGLAAVTKEYGIPGVLGRTKDEEREAKKKAEEEKREEKKAKLQQAEENLKKLPPTATDAEITAPLHDLNPKDTAEIDAEVLSRPHIAKHLKASQLAEISKSIKGRHSSAIRNAITAAVAPAGTPPTPTAGTPEQQTAYKWLTQSPAGIIF